MKVGVIGSGSIGPDLAYGFLSALANTGGASVTLVDIRQEALDAGVKRIHGYLNKGLVRGKISKKAAERMHAALKTSLSLDALADCSYVLEAASEDLPIKRKILASLEEVVAPDALIGFATSGIPRARIAAEAKHPERCFVNHPFFPAWRSLPIEVVLSGDDELGARMMSTMKRLGKVPVETADAVCFAADDIFCNYCAEAARLVEEGVATPAQIDVVVHGAIGGGGPLNVLDQTRGNLLVKHCQELMEEVREDGRWFKSPAILAERGSTLWHDGTYSADKGVDEATAKTILDRILAVLFARTLFVVEEEICTATETNWMTRTALGFSRGLVDLAHQTGADEVARLCAAYAADHPGFEIPKCIAEKSLPAFFGNLTVNKDSEGVAHLTVYRPEVKNALNARTLKEIDEAMGALITDDSVRGVVFSGFGGALAGADIGELSKMASPQEAEALCHREHAIAARIEASPKPVVCAVNGPVLGGGAELAMTCHARVVGPGLLLGQPEVNLGIIPGYGGTQRLPRIIGLNKAFEMMRVGSPINAAEALASGWAVGEVGGDITAAAKGVIEAHLSGEAAIAPLDPSPVEVPSPFPGVDIGHHSQAIDAILVDVLKRGLALPLADGLKIEAEGFGRCTETVDMHIGMTNFTQNGPRVPAEFLHE